VTARTALLGMFPELGRNLIFLDKTKPSDSDKIASTAQTIMNEFFTHILNSNDYFVELNRNFLQYYGRLLPTILVQYYFCFFLVAKSGIQWSEV